MGQKILVPQDVFDVPDGTTVEEQGCGNGVAKDVGGRFLFQIRPLSESAQTMSARYSATGVYRQ